MDMYEGSAIARVPLLDPPVAPPMVIMVSQQDQDWIDQIRFQSYHLAIERGHLRYN